MIVFSSLNLVLEHGTYHLFDHVFDIDCELSLTVSAAFWWPKKSEKGRVGEVRIGE